MRTDEGEANVADGGHFLNVTGAMVAAGSSYADAGRVGGFPDDDDDDDEEVNGDEIIAVEEEEDKASSRRPAADDVEADDRDAYVDVDDKEDVWGLGVCILKSLSSMVTTRAREDMGAMGDGIAVSVADSATCD